MRRVVILRHARQRLDKPLYFLGAIAEVWRQRGIEVLVMSGLDPPVEADLAILHIDLTRIPQPYLDAAARWPRVLNLRPHDISKRAISRHRVQPGDGYRGPVIIKTDANSAGEPEARLARSRSWMRRRWHKLRKRLPGVPRRQRLNYRIFASPDEVPAALQCWPGNDVSSSACPSPEGSPAAELAAPRDELVPPSAAASAIVATVGTGRGASASVPPPSHL